MVDEIKVENTVKVINKLLEGFTVGEAFVVLFATLREVFLQVSDDSKEQFKNYCKEVIDGLQ